MMSCRYISILLVINKITLCCIQFGMLHLSVLNIGFVQSSNYKTVERSCEAYDYDYEPAYIMDVFYAGSVDNLSDKGRTADYAILSPTIVKVGCIKWSKYSSTNMYIAMDVKSMYECSLFCARNPEEDQPYVSHLTFGYKNMTCYCLDDVNLTPIVSGKCLNESNDIYKDYVTVYKVYDSTSSSNITEILPYENENYLKLCQYVSVTSTNNATLVFGECNLQIDGIICNINSSTTLPTCTDDSDIRFGIQCILQGYPKSLDDAQSLCGSHSGYFTYKPDLNNIQSMFIGYRKGTLYALNGYREIYTYRAKFNGTECVYVLNNSDNLFITIENCNIISPNVCYKSGECQICTLILLGISIVIICTCMLAFIAYTHQKPWMICYLLNVVFGLQYGAIEYCRNKHNNNVNLNTNEIELDEFHRQSETNIDIRHSNDDHVHTSSVLLSNIDVDSDAVSGRLLNDDDTTDAHDSNIINSVLDFNDGAVPGRMLNESGSGFIYSG
ncbi:hypothetical protein ACF0H5_008032 [Mactra antiquata]